MLDQPGRLLRRRLVEERQSFEHPERVRLTRHSVQRSVWVSGDRQQQALSLLPAPLPTYRRSEADGILKESCRVAGWEIGRSVRLRLLFLTLPLSRSQTLRLSHSLTLPLFHAFRQPGVQDDNEIIRRQILELADHQLPAAGGGAPMDPA